MRLSTHARTHPTGKSKITRERSSSENKSGTMIFAAVNMEKCQVFPAMRGVARRGEAKRKDQDEAVKS